MSAEEAYDILGLSTDKSKEAINKAFRKLMLANHPDKGGSQYITTKIIEARKVLIG